MTTPSLHEKAASYALADDFIASRDHALAENHPIRITTHQLPIIEQSLFNGPLQTETALSAPFDNTRIELKH